MMRIRIVYVRIEVSTKSFKLYTLSCFVLYTLFKLLPCGFRAIAYIDSGHNYTEQHTQQRQILNCISCINHLMHLSNSKIVVHLQ